MKVKLNKPLVNITKRSPLIHSETVFAYQNQLSSILIVVDPMDFVKDWKKTGKLADVISDYISFSYKDYKKIEVVISIVLNELLENAVKYSYEKSKITIISESFENEIKLQIKNSCTDNQFYLFNEFLNEIAKLREMIDYDRITVKYIKEDSSSLSQLGFITLLKNYPIRLTTKVTSIGTNNNFTEITCDIRIE